MEVRAIGHSLGDTASAVSAITSTNYTGTVALTDQQGEGIDVLVSHHRGIASSRRFFTTSLTAHRSPAEVITDRAPALANVIDELIPAAFHNTGQYENNWC